MRAVTSLIVLVTLVAFGGSVALAPNIEDPYRVLDAFLKSATESDNLKANVEKLENLPTRFNRYTDKFHDLADAFRSLKDDEENGRPQLCSESVLANLRFLIVRAPDPPTGADRLNSLLIKLREGVREKCYEYLQSEWDKLKEAGRMPDAARYTTREIVYLDSKVPLDNAFKRLIYRPEGTPDDITENDNRKFEKIIRDALLAGQKNSLQKPLSSPRLTLETVEQRLEQRLKNPCIDLHLSLFAEKILRSALEVVALEMIHFPGERERPHRRKRHFEINFLPAYVVCKKLIGRSHRGLIFNLHKLLVDEASAQNQRSFLSPVIEKLTSTLLNGL